MAYTNIDDPSAHFQTKLYTGNGSTQSITNDGNSDLQPDLIWAKNRNDAYDNVLGDSTRGAGLTLISNSTSAEVNEGTNGLTSFDSDGFSLGGNSGGWNFSSAKTYAAWQWKANGGTTSSNTSGTITSTVQANTDAGFSIVTYTGNGGTPETFGHGLGVAPKIVIVKRRSSAQSWTVYSEAIGATNYLRLNATNASAASGGHWVNTAPTSTLVTIGDNGEVNGSSETYVAYCFAEKQGYSKFGKYTGNGNADGPFVYTGFKPAWVMIKSSSSSTDGNWYILDNKRDTYNVTKKTLEANTSGAEVTPYDRLDFLSNGFKNRVPGSNGWNVSGQTYIYMAFAENPFVTSTGIPTTAR